jgi:hypothetical protein
MKVDVWNKTGDWSGRADNQMSQSGGLAVTPEGNLSISGQNADTKTDTKGVKTGIAE